MRNVYFPVFQVKHNNIDVESIAHGTVGFTGADIANLVNQAAILACLENVAVVAMDHMWKARDKIMFGTSSSKPKDLEINRITAYHESGHALVAYYSPHNKTKIQKVKISRQFKSTCTKIQRRVSQRGTELIRVFLSMQHSPITVLDEFS